MLDQYYGEESLNAHERDKRNTNGRSSTLSVRRRVISGAKVPRDWSGAMRQVSKQFNNGGLKYLYKSTESFNDDSNASKCSKFKKVQFSG